MINQTILHYRILGQLGSGGMGVVYEAEDFNLGRKVALKFLPPQLARDRNALDRFLLEARTASALNHPNICTIYAVENANSSNAETQSFIAMELLDGQTLAEKLLTGPLPIDRLLDTGIQLADALDAAHGKGIIHRDIKPANIFLTQRGQVKVLDFGLAKLARPEIQRETLGPTQDSPAHLTSPGATVGTIAYMSPEQARGENLDTRTDLFSLGAVLYQMATGKLPFSGATSAVIFHGILQLDPLPLQQLVPGVPLRLQEIVEKLLEKDRDLRYQSAADLRGDLKRLKRDTESGRKPAPSANHGAEVPAPMPPSSSTVPVSQPTSSSAAVAAVRRSKLGLAFAVAMASLLLAAAGYGIYAFVARNKPLPFQDISVTKVTDSGDALYASISPDGQYILSLMRTNGRTGLWLRNVPTNSNVEVQPPEEVYYNGARFSPDGNYFYFVRSDPGNDDLRYLYRAPLLGGAPQKLAADVDSNVAVSPDGKNLAFMRFNNPEPGKYQLIVRPVENGEGAERVVASGPIRQSMYSPTWSPDGKTIVCSELKGGIGVASLTAVNVATGAKKVFFIGDSQMFEDPVWMPDGSGVLGMLHGSSATFNQTQIAFVTYPGGKLTPITHDTNAYSFVSVAANGRILTSVLTEGRWFLDVSPASTLPSTVHQVAATEASTNFTWTKDGALIADQKSVLNRMDPVTGSRATLATEDGSASGNPSACANGRYVVFEMGLRKGNSDDNLWRMDSSGGNLKQLTTGKNDNHPVCSSDSQWVYYLRQADQATLARVPIDGGVPQGLSKIPIVDNQFDISRDGKSAAFATLEHSGEHKVRLVIVATDSGQARQLDFEHEIFGLLRFSPDSKGVVYPTRNNGVDNLWLQPLDGAKGKSITDFTSEHIYDFHWSFDGKQLAMVRGHNDSDVVLIRNAQQ
jgi:eukaryotic-like serine/threonine-protein kinase